MYLQCAIMEQDGCSAEQIEDYKQCLRNARNQYARNKRAVERRAALSHRAVLKDSKTSTKNMKERYKQFMFEGCDYNGDPLDGLIGMQSLRGIYYRVLADRIVGTVYFDRPHTLVRLYTAEPCLCYKRATLMNGYKRNCKEVDELLPNGEVHEYVKARKKREAKYKVRFN